MPRRPHRLAHLTFVASVGIQVSPAWSQAGEAASSQMPLMPRDDTALRTELRQQQDLVLLLRQRLANAEQANVLVPWLLGGVVVLGALTVWLGWQLRRRGRPSDARQPQYQRSQSQRDAEDSVGPATVFAPGLASLMQQESSAELDQVSTKGMPSNPMADPGSMVLGGAGTLAVAMAPAGLAPALGARPASSPAPAPAAPSAAVRHGNQDTKAAGAGGGAGIASPIPPAFSDEPPRAAELTMVAQTPRPVSVEELFDLEQQVDFFLVLGQTESAVDLLVSHIRGTGGNSALPYLKLMEVYRQLGDADSHERTRKRFNQRFNAHAPDLSADPAQGRALDEYPEVLSRLVRAWPMPLDALAELEAMLFRRSRGELFDLPAFRDVLLLHAMTLDLHERSPMSASRVDILLPLGEELSDNTAPLPHMVAPAPPDSARQLLANWGGLGDEPVAGKDDGQLSGHDGAVVRARAAASAPAAPAPDLPPRARTARPAAEPDMFTLDLDLSDFAPAPKEYTHPAAFTDLAMRADFSPMPLAAANDQPLGGSAAPAKPKF